jgi:hypothetical protein
MAVPQQWYVEFRFGDDLALAEIDANLVSTTGNPSR